MREVSQGTPIFNQVILSMEPEARSFLLERAAIRPIAAGELIYLEGQTLSHAVFPHHGIVSMVAELGNGKIVEKVSIGNEGMIGFSHLLGGHDAVGKTIVQIPGYASFIALQDLDEAITRFRSVQEAVLVYARALIVQLMEAVKCNSRHSAEQRISLWLLRAHDRMGGEGFPLTQEALSELLGLRRATVSEVCSALSNAGLIAHSRGSMNVIDHDGLRGRVCECYARIAAADSRGATRRPAHLVCR